MDKAKLLERIQKGPGFVEGSLAELSDADRNRVGTLEHWAPKDVLAHIATWQMRWVNWLAPLEEGKLPADEGPAPMGEENQANARIFAENQARPWDLVHKDYQTVSRQILRLAGRLSGEDLNTPKRFPWLDDRTLARRLSTSFYWHVQAHLAQIFIDRKEAERAIRVAEDFASQVGPDEPAEDRGTGLYNLACYCALAGKSQLALSHLKTALSIYPGLIESSKTDTDLDSLRGLAEFRSIYPTSPRSTS